MSMRFYVGSQGFVRMALEHGAPLIPAFCFGQSGTFHWIRPGPPLFSDALVTWLASRLGFLPVYVYGYGFLPMPFRVRFAKQLDESVALLPLVHLQYLQTLFFIVHVTVFLNHKKRGGRGREVQQEKAGRRMPRHRRGGWRTENRA